MRAVKVLAVFFTFWVIGCSSFNRSNRLQAMELEMLDSVSIFNTRSIAKDTPTILMFFSPDCEHCQKFTEALLPRMKELKNDRFIFITIDPLERLRVYNDYYNIYKYTNILLARDFKFEFYNKYRPTTTPVFLFFDGQKEIRYIYSGGITMTQLIESLEKIK